MEKKIFSAYQAQQMSAKKEKTLEDIMSDIELMSSVSRESTMVHLEKFYISKETQAKLNELGYKMDISPNYEYLRISWGDE